LRKEWRVDRRDEDCWNEEEEEGREGGREGGRIMKAHACL